MRASQLIELFVEIAGDVRTAIDDVPVWGPSGRRPDQYTIDVAADEQVIARLVANGLAVLSEESGTTGNDNADVLVVVDPIDGSTNAAAGLPWFATSFCALDAQGPLAAVVVNQATGDVWHAIRGDGAWRNQVAISTSSINRLDQALVAVSGLPAVHLGWKQFRCYGAAALDLCAVADGTFDAFADLSVDAHGSWDYLGGLLILREAGGMITDAQGRDLVARGHKDRRTPIGAASTELHDELGRAMSDHWAALSRQ